MAGCNQCGGSVEFSVCSLISTKGQRPRRQKCSQAVLSCEACMRHCISLLEHSPLADCGERLQSAHTAIATHSASPGEQDFSRPDTSEVTQ